MRTANQYVWVWKLGIERQGKAPQLSYKIIFFLNLAAAGVERQQTPTTSPPSGQDRVGAHTVRRLRRLQRVLTHKTEGTSLFLTHKTVVLFLFLFSDFSVLIKWGMEDFL